MIGERLRKSRKKLSLTQADVAAQAGVDQSYIARYEQKASIGGLRNLQKICAVLGLTLSDVLSDTITSEAEQELLVAFRRLESRDQEAISRHANALVRDTELRRIMG